MVKRLLILLLFLPFLSRAASVWSIGFYVPYTNFDAPYTNHGIIPGPVTNIQWSALTHIVQYAYNVRTNGTLTDGSLGTTALLISEAHSRGIKVLLGLGANTNMSLIVTNHLNTFINEVMLAVTSNGFDGVDIDYELNYETNIGAILFPAMRSVLGTNLLTLDARTTEYALFYPIRTNLDRVNVMTYGMGKFYRTYAYFNSPLYGGETLLPEDRPSSIERAVTLYITHGWPSTQVNISVPFFGQYWIGGTPTITHPRQALTGKPSIQELYYGPVNATNSLASPSYDNEAMQAWVTMGGSLYTFENTQSIESKVGFIYDKHLGGLMIWYLDGDYDSSATPKHPLQNAVDQAFARYRTNRVVVGTVNASKLSN